jgi:large subunit ribosomal protein L4
MASITLKNPAGNDAGTLDLDASMFGVQPNVPLMHQVVTAQLAARRSGTQSTKTRAEVRGGGKKPFKQKGTGNARQGSTRSPHMSGTTRRPRRR